MYALGKEKGQITNDLIFSKDFIKYSRILLELFTISRLPENHKNAAVICEIQRGIGKYIQFLESSLKPKQRKLKDQGRDDWNNDMDIFAHKRLIKISRSIMDGVVWRNMDYKRTWSVFLSHNKRNSLDENFERLLEAAYIFSQFYVPIISDLTETARIGDFLFFTDDGVPIITEAKNRKDGKLDLHNFCSIDEAKQPSKQMEKVLDTQDIILSGKVSRLNMDIIDDNEHIQFRYFDKIKAGLIVAAKKGYWVDRLNKVVSVRIFDTNSIGNLNKDQIFPICKRAEKLVTWEKDDKIFTISNLDTFQVDDNFFLKGFPPYSVFPFDNETCMRIMTGEIQIVSHINMTELCRFYEQNGWGAKLHTFGGNKEELSIHAKNFSGLFGENHANDKAITLSKDGGYYQTLSLLEILRLGYEFLSPKSLLDFSEYLYKTGKESGKKQSRSLAYNFLRDKEIFI